MLPNHSLTIDKLPEDVGALQSMVRDLHMRLLRMEVEMARLKKWYYGPRADRLNSDAELG